VELFRAEDNFGPSACAVYRIAADKLEQACIALREENLVK
jgi:hypothetical protein